VVPDPAAALARLAAHVRGRAPATVVGVTGSSGKTTTKDLLADLLARLGPTTAAPGSFNNEIGLPLTLLRVEPDTSFAVIEMGARGIGHIADLARLARPHVGCVLNVGSAHMGGYADGRRGIAVAKGELAEAASDLVVLNADDPLVAEMADRARAEVVTFGEHPKAAVRAERVEVDRLGRASFDLVVDGERHRVRLGLVGAHQVANALAATAAAVRLGLSPAEAAAGLAEARPRSRWRMEVTTAPSGLIVVNDAYNANPESMRAALKALVDMRADGRAWAVLGPMAELGDISDAAHEDIGRLAVRLGVDRLVAVGPEARRIHLGASLEGSWDGESIQVPGVDEAVALVAAEARPGDVVLVKASRAHGLERVAAGLLDPGLPTAGAPAGGDGGAHGDRRDDGAGDGRRDGAGRAGIEGTGD